MPALIPCPDCGRAVSTRAVSCPQCGYPVAAFGSVPAPRLPATPTCPGCLTEIRRSDAAFCEGCGRSLSGLTTSQPRIPSDRLRRTTREPGRAVSPRHGSPSVTPSIRVVLGSIGAVVLLGTIYLSVRETRRRNEADTIQDLRRIVSSQGCYQSENDGWYESRLACLARPETCIPGYPHHGPFSFALAGDKRCLLGEELAAGGPRNGYARRLVAGPRPRVLRPGLSSPTSIQSYAYTATPTEGFRSGARSFCADATGRLCFRRDGIEIAVTAEWSCPVGAGCEELLN
jgi:hypothetical protein